MSYVSFSSRHRDQGQRLDKELEDWVVDNVAEIQINYASWRVSGKRVMVGVMLDKEQQVFFRLKFGK
jgi:hypothetical protein